MNKERIYIVIDDNGEKVLKPNNTKIIRGYDLVGFTNKGNFYRIQKEATKQDIEEFNKN